MKLWRREWREPLGNFNRNRREMDSTGCRRSRASPGFSFVGCIVMNFEDERYVRLFTRDSLTWLSWGWETRAVFVLTLRKLDRAGVLDTGKMDKSTAVALLIGVPNDVASRALKQLTSDGTATETPNAIVFPRFLEAQECKQSDAHRQRESRVNRRTKAVSERIHDVVSHTASHGVTDGHTVSQLVTPAVPSQPCLAEPAVPNLSMPSKSAPTPRKKAPPDPRVTPLTERLVAAFAELRGGGFEHGGAPAAQALKRLLAHSDPDEIERRWRIGLTATGWRRVSSFVDLAIPSKWNDLNSSTPTNTRAPVAAESVDWSKVQSGEVDL